MLGAIAALFFQTAGSPAPALLNLAPPTAAALVDSLESAELRFFFEWRELFKRVMEPPRPQTGTDAAARALRTLRDGLAHCHPDNDDRDSFLPVPGSQAITSTRTTYGACPSWGLADSLLWDERLVPDAALGDTGRVAVRQVRLSLIALFDGAARAFPSHEWIAGQRVRLLVDQREFDRAAAAARECAAPHGWCGMLAGYVLSTRGMPRAADSAFTDALRSMTLQERCRWNNVNALLDSASRAVFGNAPSCEVRDSISQRVLWLADPLFSEPWNERRAEHYARLVLIALRASLDRDERYDWREEAGGDALAEMVTRYGWPSYTYYGGGMLDASHSGYLGLHRSPRHSPYTTFEYAGGRVQTVPALHAIADPMRARADDWMIVERTIRAKSNIYADDRASRALSHLQKGLNAWWPQEFFTPLVPMVPLPEGQVAFLRRETGVVFASAVDLAGIDLGRRDSTNVTASLVISVGPDSVQRIATSTAKIGNTLTLHGLVGTRPALAAIEYPGDAKNGLPAGRTRFGIAPPMTLASMRAGEIAVSDIVLIAAPPKGTDLATDPERMLPAMRGSTELPKGSHIGVYWETYGITPGDSVEIAVWIERTSAQGILRRFGIALNVATDLNTPVATSWTEAGPGARNFVIPGRVPVVGRSVVLDASRLAPGEYSLDVVVRKRGGEPVRGRRAFSIPR